MTGNRMDRGALWREPQAAYSPRPLGLPWQPSGAGSQPVAQPWNPAWRDTVGQAPTPSASPPQAAPAGDQPIPVDIGGSIGDGKTFPEANPAAPPGWKPEWGRPIDPGIGDGTIPDSWRDGQPPRPQPPGWPRPGWPGSGPGNQPLPSPSAYSQDLVNEYRQMDLNGDGTLSEVEYVEGKMAQIRYFRAPTDAENEAMRQRLRAEFRQGDVNRDGRMSLDEFANNPVFHTQ